MLHENDQETWELTRDPVLKEGVAPFSTFTRRTGQFLTGWFFLEPGEGTRKVAVPIHNGVTCLWVFVKALRQHDDCTEVDVVAPPVTQNVALEFDVFDELRILDWLKWWNGFSERDRNGTTR